MIRKEPCTTRDADASESNYSVPGSVTARVSSLWQLSSNEKERH